jgi:hypothetical protein
LTRPDRVRPSRSGKARCGGESPRGPATRCRPHTGRSSVGRRGRRRGSDRGNGPGTPRRPADHRRPGSRALAAGSWQMRSRSWSWLILLFVGGSANSRGRTADACLGTVCRWTEPGVASSPQADRPHHRRQAACVLLAVAALAPLTRARGRCGAPRTRCRRRERPRGSSSTRSSA